MNYIDPKTVVTPKGAVTQLNVIYDGDENEWSLAALFWYNEYSIGVRWNGSHGNKELGIKSTLSNPQSRGYPTWFILPSEIARRFLTGYTLILRIVYHPSGRYTLKEKYVFYK